VTKSASVRFMNRVFTGASDCFTDRVPKHLKNTKGSMS